MATNPIAIQEPGPDFHQIQRDLERAFRTRIPDDDPLWITIHGVHLMARANWEATVSAISDQLTSQLSDFHRELDIALKARQQDGHTNILKMLAVAQGQLKLAGQEAQNEIRQETAELVSAAKELRSVNRSMRYYDWLVGFFFATLVLVVGVVVGLIYARSG